MEYKPSTIISKSMWNVLDVIIASSEDYVQDCGVRVAIRDVS